jgi:hypothetical protein
MEAEGNLEWDSLPYEPDYEGEEIAGYVAGTITALTKLTNSDNLAKCLTN